MKTEPHIGINGLFLRKSGSGIGQVTSYFLRTLANKKNVPFSYTIYTDSKEASVPLGPSGKLVYVKPWWQRDDRLRKLLWEYLQLPGVVAADRLTHFISLYQAPTILPYGQKHIMVVHDMIPEIFSEYQNNFRSHLVWRLTKRALRKASFLVAVSQSTKRDSIRFLKCSAANITVAYPSVNPIFFQETIQDQNRKQESKRVLEKYNLAPGYLYHGGGLEIRKNTRSILTAYAAWVQGAKSTESVVPPLVISGIIHDAHNPLATDVKGLVEKLGLKDSVHLIGFVPANDLPVLYKEASLFLFPSLYEGFGMPVVEALSQGTAVMALKNSSLSEVGGESVWWVEEVSKETLEENYQRAIASSPEEGEIRQAQARHFRSWEPFTENTINTLLQ